MRAWLDQTGRLDVFKCRGCRAEFRLVENDENILVVDMRESKPTCL